MIVITDEAHRTQYRRSRSTCAGRCRTPASSASPGTPLIAGEEERTREVFGDYVSIYNFRDSIEDGATVPLFYENRIPELQIINERFDEELDDDPRAAELDDRQETRARAAVRHASTS